VYCNRLLWVNMIDRSFAVWPVGDAGGPVAHRREAATRRRMIGDGIA
jgi:hypothetical protein